MKGQFSLHLSAVRRFGNDIISGTVAPQSAPDLVLSPAMRFSFQRKDGIPKPKGTACASTFLTAALPDSSTWRGSGSPDWVRRRLNADTYHYFCTITFHS